MTLIHQEDTIEKMQSLFLDLNDTNQENIIIYLIENLRGFDPESRVAQVCLNFSTVDYFSPH